MDFVQTIVYLSKEKHILVDIFHTNPLFTECIYFLRNISQIDINNQIDYQFSYSLIVSILMESSLMVLV